MEKVRDQERLRNFIIVSIIYLIVSLLIALTSKTQFFWSFYFLAIFWAAITLDEIGGVTTALISALAIFGFYFLFNFKNDPLATQHLIEFSISSLVMLIIGLGLGFLARLQKEYQAYLRETSRIDRVTSLYNYGYFAERLEEERKRADRFGSNLALIMIDIDNFRSFNERFGHVKGNRLLRKLAKILKEQVRVVDIVTRYGGEELAIILPNTAEEATKVAERIRRAVEEAGFEGDEREPVTQRTISAGVAVYPKHCQSELELIDKAELALHRAKKKGRNTVCLYDPKLDKVK